MSKKTSTPRPHVMTQEDVHRIREHFPDEMIKLPQWVPYKLRWSAKTGKFDKIPMNPKTGYNAKSNNPDTWGRFDTAVKRALNRGMGGIGFVFSRDDPYVGIDLDKCINDGEIESWATDIIAEIDSYTELSPSGNGYHIIGRGKLPPRGRRKDRIEMYDSNRFFTVTGLVNGNSELRDIQKELHTFHARVFKKTKTHSRSSLGKVKNRSVITDDDLITRAINSKNGAKFSSLWSGNWNAAGYPSQSEADQALSNILAWWTDYDALRLDSLFRQSGLFRPDKWDKPHFSDGKTYGQVTVELALEGHSPGDGFGQASKKSKRSGNISTSSLPRIVVNRQLNEIMTDTWSLVHQANDDAKCPLIYLRHGQLVRIRQDMIPETIELFSKDSVTTFLFNNADWIMEGENFIRPAKPPREIVASLISDPDIKIPQLELLETVPFFSKDGKLIQNEGYYKDLKVWLKLSSDLENISVPENPTPQEVESAVSLFMDDLLVDFPFVSQADRANCIGAFILPFVRSMIDDVTPLQLFEAPTPGSGKGLLSSLLSLLCSGEEVVIQVFTYQEEELRKRVSSELLKGRPIIAFDNADTRRKLHSPALAAILTARVWGDRELGRNSDITVINNAIWVMTGNNMEVSSELADRMVRIRIDPKIERPRDRDPRKFKHHPIKQWVRQNRKQLVTAALTLAQAWINAGMPFSGKEYGSFERWSRIIGGILENAGIKDFLVNRNEFFEQADQEMKMWHDFVNAWWDEFGDNAVQAKQLNELCENQELMLTVRRDGNERSQVTLLGKALKNARDSVKGNYLIEANVFVQNTSGSHRNNGYKLTKIEQPDNHSSQKADLADDIFELQGLEEECPF